MPSPSVRAGTASSPTMLRVFTNRPGLTLAGLAIAGTALGFQHFSATLRENELRQKNNPLYVSVDRSGGGI
ncbi:hypothetical protein QBC38DRAFT_246863 [Podospora fimiseda]|uniref:Uncharacterized protein n=1 Tax=Podospora fimiseda TaxID=252190 RepID=A0AAN7BXB9_9PEZI|nr:hypothetical protein QBC38DRAFT_246863 [Podospora fimiseda]